MNARVTPVVGGSKQPRSLRRPFAVLAALAMCFPLAACDSPRPTVTWFGNGTSVDEGPSLYCQLISQLEVGCPVTDGPPARLSLHVDDPVQVNIPAEIAEKPWWLVISYADGSSSYRTPLFDDGKTLSYIVHPAPGHPLKQIDLQIPIITAGAQGEAEWPPYQIWVLAIDQVA